MKAKTKPASKARKFQPGDRVWLYDDNRRVYTDDSGRPNHENSYVEYEITGISGRSYNLARVWYGQPKGRHLGSGGTVGFDKAERLYLTTAEKDDAVYLKTYRNWLAESVRMADAATLRRVQAAMEGPTNIAVTSPAPPSAAEPR